MNTTTTASLAECIDFKRPLVFLIPFCLLASLSAIPSALAQRAAAEALATADVLLSLFVAPMPGEGGWPAGASPQKKNKKDPNEPNLQPQLTSI